MKYFLIFFLLIENVLTLETRKQDSFSHWSYEKKYLIFLSEKVMIN